MSGTDAVRKLPDLTAAIQRHADAVRTAAEYVAARWEGLNRAGGGRDDHAAALLKTHLRGPIDEAAQYLARVTVQIDATISDAFNERNR